jgi:hypothetical protein
MTCNEKRGGLGGRVVLNAREQRLIADAGPAAWRNATADAVVNLQTK